MEERDREVQQQERDERIQKSRWNKWYKKLRTLGMPKYLKEVRKEKKMIRAAKFTKK